MTKKNKQLNIFNRKKYVPDTGYVLIGTATIKRWFRYSFIEVIENKNFNIIKTNLCENVNDSN